ncbi:MAG: amidohydrolase family protein [Anaerovoracaceae bacterium]
MIIDSHAHSDEFIETGWIDPPEKVIEYMDMAGIDMACISTYCNAPGFNPNAVKYIAAARDKYPDRFIPFIRLDPNHGQKTLDTLKEAIEVYGFKGVKLHPVDYALPAFAPTVIKIMQMAGEYGMPVLYHCSDELMCLPLEIEAGIAEAPETNIILGHMGGFYHQNDAIEIAKRNPNVYLETCEQPFTWGIKKAVEEIGADRVLFGTDIPTDNPILEVEKIKSAKLGKEAEEMIFYKNIARLLKLNV